jgi:murein DD-endopeptidase MepM/ murein hydrolase activator NlpD
MVVRVKASAQRPPAKVFSRATKPAGSRAHSHGVRPGLFYGVFAGLLATNAITLVGFLMAPDISQLLDSRTDTVVAAYEDRIAQLRLEVDRLHSRQFAQTGDINLQLQELSQQQELLLEQHQLVKQLATKAAELGIDAASLPGTEPASAAGGAIAPLAFNGTPKSDDLERVSSEMLRMMDESRLALAGLAEKATESTDTILSELSGIGIKPKMPEGLNTGMGGPYLPAADGPDTDSIVDDANDVFLALARFQAARGAIDLAPIHKPMASLARKSSSFGNRRDPFTGGRAFHSGNDYPAPKGTIVMSAGYGKVTFVGEKSGYGMLVEITHAAGLVTRYGHLSAFLVKEGQTVNTGTPIAKVGSTGRSTGPHLHFEVRRKDQAVDPSMYLAVGARLAGYIGA